MTRRRAAGTGRRGAHHGVVAGIVAATLAAGGQLGTEARTSSAADGEATVTAPCADIVFARLMDEPEDHEIWTMDRAGRHQQRLTWNDFPDLDPQWSPDGERIAWVRHGSEGVIDHSDVWVMDADGSDRHRLTDTNTTVNSPTWSPDGSRIAFSSASRIWVMNADGSGLHPLSPVDSTDVEPDWSPDGEWIAFTARGPRSFDLHVMRSDGTDRRLVADTFRLAEFRAAWSPDGRRIAYDAGRDVHPSSQTVRVIRPDGTGRRIVVDQSHHPTWKPGNHRLVFVECAERCSLHTSNLRGDNVTRLGYRGYDDIAPDYRLRRP